MSASGPSRHFAPPHDFGRKRGIAEVDGQPSTAEGDAGDPKQTFCGSAQEALLIQFERSLGTAKARAGGDASPRGSSLWHPRLAQAFNDPLALR